jgi:hypothetical protein
LFSRTITSRAVAMRGNTASHPFEQGAPMPHLGWQFKKQGWLLNHKLILEEGRRTGHFGKRHNKNTGRRGDMTPKSVILSEAGVALARGPRVEGSHARRKRHERRKAFSLCFVQAAARTPCSAAAAAGKRGVPRLRRDDRGYGGASLFHLYRLQSDRHTLRWDDERHRSARSTTQE